MAATMLSLELKSELVTEGRSPTSRSPGRPRPAEIRVPGPKAQTGITLHAGGAERGHRQALAVQLQEGWLVKPPERRRSQKSRCRRCG